MGVKIFSAHPRGLLFTFILAFCELNQCWEFDQDCSLGWAEKILSWKLWTIVKPLYRDAIISVIYFMKQCQNPTETTFQSCHNHLQLKNEVEKSLNNLESCVISVLNLKPPFDLISSNEIRISFMPIWAQEIWKKF